jgi:hypothetical protein
MGRKVTLALLLAVPLFALSQGLTIYHYVSAPGGSPL